MLSLLYLGVHAEQYFANWSCMFLDTKNLLKIWLNPGLNSTIFRGTRPWMLLLTHGTYVANFENSFGLLPRIMNGMHRMHANYRSHALMDLSSLVISDHLCFDYLSLETCAKDSDGASMFPLIVDHCRLHFITFGYY